MKRLFQAGIAVALAFSICTPILHADNPRETPLVLALRKAKYAVVNIHSEKTAPNSETLFGSAKARKVNGMGTGIVIDSRGYIVTNHHVVDRVDSLRVTLFDGSTYSAKVITYNRRKDLAIIKIKPTKPLSVMKMGTSSDLMLGESVFAVGNAFGYENTVTSGIISQLSRNVEVNEEQSYQNLIQTDASINPGNSGGPLINMKGEVIGINVAIRAGAQRIGFAIPIDDARRVISRLLSIETLDHNYHGLQTRDLKSKKQKALVVSSATRLSPAEKAGFKPGDLIVKVDKLQVEDAVDFERALLGRSAGDKVKVVVKRGESEKSLTLVLGKYDRATVVRANNNVDQPESLDEKIWRVLGMKLTKLATPNQFLAGSKYNGGMMVSAVRQNGPADLNGIRKGDILVGLHIWETVNLSNVAYVLNSKKLHSFNPLKFYILRGRNTLYGNMRISVK